jgi:hypothetical protein
MGTDIGLPIYVSVSMNLVLRETVVLKKFPEAATLLIGILYVYISDLVRENDCPLFRSVFFVFPNNSSYSNHN